MNGVNSEKEKIYPVLKTDLLSQTLTESLIQKEISERINKINSFNNHIQNIKDMKDYFFNTSKHNKKMYKHYKHLSLLVNILESVVVIGTTSTSIVVGLAGLAPFIIPIAAGGGISATMLNRIINETIKVREKKYLKMYTLTNKYLQEFMVFHKKALEDNKIDQNEYSKLCNIFNTYVDKKKENMTKTDRGAAGLHEGTNNSFLVGTGDVVASL